jgi:hypothetical protein
VDNTEAREKPLIIFSNNKLLSEHGPCEAFMIDVMHITKRGKYAGGLFFTMAVQ